MSNPWGRSGAPMIQPTKDEIREWLAEARTNLRDEKTRRRRAEYRLGVATRTLGKLALEGKIPLPSVQAVGELVLQVAMEEEAEIARNEREEMVD